MSANWHSRYFWPALSESGLLFLKTVRGMWASRNSGALLNQCRNYTQVRDRLRDSVRRLQISFQWVSNLKNEQCEEGVSTKQEEKYKIEQDLPLQNQAVNSVNVTTIIIIY